MECIDKQYTDIPTYGSRRMTAWLVEKPNQVWSTDITYCRLTCGFMYLVAVIDWYSRYILSWERSNTLDAEFCVVALNRVLDMGQQEIYFEEEDL
jgi:transposase InsO family protein